MLALPSIPTRRVDRRAPRSRWSRRAAARVVRGRRPQLAARRAGRRRRCSRSCSSIGPTPRPFPRSPAARRCPSRLARDRARRRGHRGRGRRSRRSRSSRRSPSGSAVTCGPGSIRASATSTARRRRCSRADQLDLTTRPRLSDAVVFTVDAAARRLLAGRDVRRLRRHDDWSNTRSGDDPATSAASRTTAPRSPIPPDAVRRRRRERHRVPPDVPRRGGLLRRRVRGAEPGVGRDRQAARCAARRHRAGRAGSRARDSARARSTPSYSRQPAGDRGDAARRRRDGRSRAAITQQYAQPPRDDGAGCMALARPITAGAPTTYDKIRAHRERGWARTRSTRSTRRCRRRTSTSSTTSCSDTPRRLVRADREQPRRAGAQRRASRPGS